MVGKLGVLVSRLEDKPVDLVAAEIASVTGQAVDEVRSCLAGMADGDAVFWRESEAAAVDLCNRLGHLGVTAAVLAETEI